MSRAVLLTAAAVLVAVGSGCRGQTSDEPPILPLRDMFHQQRFNPQSENTFYADKRAQRLPVEGTVARDGYIEDARIALGHEPGGEGAGYVAVIPDEVVEAGHGLAAVVERGRERYQIYCTPCHGGLGDGRGIVPVRAPGAGYNFPAPPTFHQERIRHMPDGQLFATISNGVRNMPAYAAQIPVQDRWAIVAYVRALQLSQAHAAPGAAQ